jgi:DNA polymerase-4
LAFQLRRGNKLTACITLKIRYSDFQTQTLQKHIPYTAADHELLPLVAELFERLYNRRLLVRLIGVRFSALVSGNYQLNLFDLDTRYTELYSAMDKIRLRFGDRAVLRAIGLDARTIGGHNPFNGEPPSLLANRKQ